MTTDTQMRTVAQKNIAQDNITTSALLTSTVIRLESNKVGPDSESGQIPPGIGQNPDEIRLDFKSGLNPVGFQPNSGHNPAEGSPAVTSTVHLPIEL